MKKSLSGALRSSPLGRLLDLESLALLSERAESCPLQDPFRIRVRYLGWKMASLLLDEKGELDFQSIEQLMKAFEREIYPVDMGEGDAEIFLHLSRCLKLLAENEAVQRALKKCSTPLCGKEAEKLVRDTLWPEEIGILENFHVRRAVLTACLTLLRQTTGSCFATAPAILIQQQDLLRLILDLDALLSAGELRRGSYAAPLHPGGGVGELQKPIGLLSPALSPGLRAGFHAASLPFPPLIAKEETPKSLFEHGFLSYFGLSEEDLAREKASPTPQFGVLWERMGGHFGGISSKAMQIRDWEKASDAAKRAFLSIADCALLRSWEYTLASFADVKVEFAKWNLFVSLGLHPEQTPPGIGDFLLRSIQAKLDAVNGRIAQVSAQHQKAVNAVRATEGLLHRALSDAQRNKLKAELATAIHTANNLGDQIEEDHKMADWLSKLYAQFLQEVIEKLQNSFQEVFDPAVGDGNELRFEDSLAGFRLLYKSGRTAAASWERIENEDQFTSAVYKFFESLEREASIEPAMQSCFTTTMTELLQYIRSEEFLTGALLRARENRKAKNAKPWAYESGGTMQTLVQFYYGMGSLPKEISRSIRNPLELFGFLREAASRIDAQVLLMYSPTHAFLFYPSWLRSEEAFQRGAYFFTQINVTREQVDLLKDRLAEELPFELRPLFHFGCREQPFSEGIPSLRKMLVSGWLAAKQARVDRVDGFLYESLPIIESGQAKPVMERMLQRLGLKGFVREPDDHFLTAKEVIDHVRQLLIAQEEAFSKEDRQTQLAEAARAEGLAYPEPILFGDTNWSDWRFGIVQNFATHEAELWRLSRTGLRGAPMSDWKHLFAEGGRWGILSQFPSAACMEERGGSPILEG